jgi:CDP-diacylglycerol--glycerol-3-phosphate 3-phosphatidyltransferase
MNLPNKLTTSRFGFAFLLLLCLTFSFPGAKTLALLLFLIASATDWLDGYLARTKYGVSAFGKLMDPLADKVLVTVALVSFVEIRFDPGHPESPLVPALLVVPILFREFMVTGLRLLAVEQGIVLSAGTLGKWKTALQMTAIIFTLFSLALVEDWLPEMEASTLTSIHFTLHWLIWGLMAGATAITLVSGWDYFSKNRSLFTPPSNETP